VVTVSAHFDQLGSLDIDASDNAMSSNVATILEHMVAQSTHSHLHAALRVSVESVQLQITFDHLCGKSEIFG